MQCLPFRESLCSRISIPQLSPHKLAGSQSFPSRAMKSYLEIMFIISVVPVLLYSNLRNRTHELHGVRNKIFTVALHGNTTKCSRFFQIILKVEDRALKIISGYIILLFFVSLALGTVLVPLQTINACWNHEWIIIIYIGLINNLGSLKESLKMDGGMWSRLWFIFID